MHENQKEIKYWKGYFSCRGVGQKEAAVVVQHMVGKRGHDEPMTQLLK